MKEFIRNQKLIVLIATVAVAFSCSNMFDNVEKFAANETIYSDKLDGILRVQIGFERVEIDLMSAGRIPSSRITTGKAKKTVIECPDFTEPGNRRVMDSVASWVNVTGLTELKTYKLTIYTEDEHGNRSLPLNVDVRPYTAENRDLLQLVAPVVIESTSAANVEWRDRISALTHTVYRHSYSYVDKNGNTRTGDVIKNDTPSFFLEDIEQEVDIPVTVSCWTIPTIMSFDGTYTPILDTIWWHPIVNVRISGSADPVIFLKTPGPASEFDVDETTDFPVEFSWIKVPEVSAYTLKFSLDPDFPESETYITNVGDVGEYIIDENNMRTVLGHFPKAHQMNFLWTITPTTPTANVRNQVRRVTVYQTTGPAFIDVSEFEDVATNIKGAKINFDKGGQIFIQGIGSATIAQVYNRDFFIYNPDDETLTFDGESGEWDVCYSDVHRYFWICKALQGHGPPEGYWIRGTICPFPIYNNAFNTNYAPLDQFWRFGYMRRLDNGKYQASISLASNSEFQINGATRDWVTSYVPGLTFTGNGAGGRMYYVNPNSPITISVSAGFTPGFYRMTLDTSDNTLHLEKLD